MEEAQGYGPDLFRLLVDRVADYAIFVLDPAGLVASWNTGAQRIKGYSADEIIGHHFSRFYPEEAIRTGWPQYELAEALKVGRFEDEGWRVRKDGSRFWANVVITALRDENGKHVGFAKVTRDLTDRMRMQRLEADARVMSEFVAMLAHELRNPLAPIRNALTVGQHPQRSSEQIAWAFAVIDRQSAHLASLIDDLMDVSRITSGRVRLERRRLRLSEAVDVAIESAQPAILAKNHQLSLERRADPWVRGDIVRLTQIVSNLLSNAAKYSPPGGHIEVVLEETAEHARVTVRDTGMGISQDLLPRVFDLFAQGERALDRAEGGLGIGLSVSRGLAEMHGGTLTAASAGRGCGSEFALTLPRLAPASAADSEPGVHVLVVDDNQDAAISLKVMLEMFGHTCSVAFDGDEALTAARGNPPDVVLLDIGLPGMSGWEVARQLRAQPQLGGVVIAAVSGYNAENDRRKSLEAGFDHHLPKPVTMDALTQRMPILAPKVAS